MKKILMFIAILLMAFARDKTVEPKVVYLTFDADMTSAMKRKLDDKKVSCWYSKDLVTYLKQEKIPATIFVTGMFAEVYPDVIGEMTKCFSIEIGNHSYDHMAFSGPCYGFKVLKTDDDKIKEIKKTQEILKNITGYYPRYFRYPGLCHSPKDDILVQKLGLKISNDGLLISGDAFNNRHENITNNVLEHVKNGSVIVFHLGGPNAPVTDISVKEIVSELKSQGYFFKTL